MDLKLIFLRERIRNIPCNWKADGKKTIGSKTYLKWRCSKCKTLEYCGKKDGKPKQLNACGDRY